MLAPLPQPGLCAELSAVEPVAEPVRGWRLWTVRSGAESVSVDAVTYFAGRFATVEEVVAAAGGARLASVGTDTVWEPPYMTAICDPRFHNPFSPRPAHYGVAAPQAGCQCGLWAFRNPVDLAERVARYKLENLRYAYGEVELWGRIVEHAHGWRAQHARPLFVTVVGPDELAAELARIYGAAVVAGSVPEQWTPRILDGVAARQREEEMLQAKLQQLQVRVALAKPPPRRRPLARWPWFCIGAGAALSVAGITVDEPADVLSVASLALNGAAITYFLVSLARLLRTG